MKINKRGMRRILGLLLVVVLFVVLRSLVEQNRKKALVGAIENYNLAQVQLLKSKGASCNSAMEFRIAMLEEDPTEVEKLIAAGVDVNAPDSKGTPPVIYAVNGSTIQIIKILFANGAQVNARGEEGTTALIDAVHRNDGKRVKLLLDSGADVNLQNDYQNTALDFVEPGLGAKDAAVISKLLKDAGAKSYVWSGR